MRGFRLFAWFVSTASFAMDTTKLEALKMQALKALAESRGIVPVGNRSFRATWVDAIKADASSRHSGELLGKENQAPAPAGVRQEGPLNSIAHRQKTPARSSTRPIQVVQHTTV